MEYITSEMREGGYLGRLKSANVLFGGGRHYGPHTTIEFEIDALATGFDFADKLQGTLRVKFPTLNGVLVRVNGKQEYAIINQLAQAIEGCVCSLKDTRGLFRNRAIAEARRNLERALALK